MESQSEHGQHTWLPRRDMRHTDDQLNHIFVFYPSAPVDILNSSCIAKGFLTRCPYFALFGGSVFNVRGGGKWESADF